MTLGIVIIHVCMTCKLPIIKNKLPCKKRISYVDTLTPYKAKNHQCKLSTMCSFLNNLFIVIGNNNTMESKNSVGDRNFHSKLQVGHG